MQQENLFSSDSSQQMQAAGPVICLGKTFANDQERREYFLALLAEKLKDPEFRKIEGFPVGSDKDILNLSNPRIIQYALILGLLILSQNGSYRSQNSPLIITIIENPLQQMLVKGKMILFITRTPTIPRYRIKLLCVISSTILSRVIQYLTVSVVQE